MYLLKVHLENAFQYYDAYLDADVMNAADRAKGREEKEAPSWD